MFGSDQAAFYVNVPQGVAQVVGTRLRMDLGAFFLDVTDGTDWRAGVLGERTEPTRDPIIRERILGTPSVTGIAAYASRVDPATRAFTAQATIDTAFGQVVVGSL